MSFLYPTYFTRNFNSFLFFHNASIFHTIVCSKFAITLALFHKSRDWWSRNLELVLFPGLALRIKNLARSLSRLSDTPCIKNLLFLLRAEMRLIRERAKAVDSRFGPRNEYKKIARLSTEKKAGQTEYVELFLETYQEQGFPFQIFLHMAFYSSNKLRNWLDLT